MADSQPPVFDRLFDVPDIPLLLFSWLDPSSLALSACVCRKWRNLARKARGDKQVRFRLGLAALVRNTQLLIWMVANLNEKQLTPWLRVSLCVIAAGKGILATLQWARNNGCLWDAKICAEAARGGHLGVLLWARMKGCPWDKNTCANAAAGGHLEILQWARKEGCPWDGSICAEAAGSGHLEALQWARENGCPWDEWTCARAAQGGHLATLQWARKNGCEWRRLLCLAYAKIGKHRETMTWIKGQPPDHDHS